MPGQVTLANLEDVVRYHSPRADQIPHYEAIRQAELVFIKTILEHTQACADQQAAVRLVRQAAMTANASIALDGAI